MTLKQPSTLLTLGVCAGFLLLCPCRSALANNGPTLRSPVPLSAALDLTNQMNVTLTWMDIAAETGYVIERQDLTNTRFVEIAKTTANINTYKDATGAPSTYIYRVR